MAGIMLKYSVIIPAAGQGSRMNLGYNKMLYNIDGKTILTHTIERFLKFSAFGEIILVINQLEEKEIRASLPEDQRIKIAYGGGERQDSVNAGLQQVTGDYVFVHDGARMFISDELIERMLKAVATKKEAYVCAVKVKDSIRKVKNNQIVEVLNRDELYAMQTPQICRRTILEIIHKQAKQENLLHTDEVGLLNHYGYPVQIIEGEYSNKKITTIEDL